MNANNSKNPRILIIDDDPELRKTLGEILRQQGYDTLTAKNGSEALDILNNDVSIALIDLGLPDISGLDVLDRIKNAFPTVEAIILTGNTTLNSAIDATNKGAFSYLLKPYEIEQLLLHIKRAIEKQQAIETIISHNKELEAVNSELKILYEISQAISRTIDLKELLSEVLHTLFKTEYFCFEQKGAAFITDAEKLRLVSHICFSEAQQGLCSAPKIGECLCGLAAKTGQIIISESSATDKRHCIHIPNTPPHGHVILPLISVGKTFGVISLETTAGAVIDNKVIKLLSILSNQIGIAVNNALLYEEAKNFSLHAPLTGLANRRFLQIQMGKNIEASKRYQENFSLIMLDIDHFKHYNDSHGHLEGDMVLVRLAAILTMEMRESDYVFRYGGEEFLILLPRTDLQMACETAERLRRVVESSMGITISLGVSSYPESTNDGKSLIVNADIALYRAKHKGRNTVSTAL